MTCRALISPSQSQLLKMDCVKNMKIGISTVNFGKEISEKKLELRKKAGFQGVEFLAVEREYQSSTGHIPRRLICL
jgi:sugar phosphate isomerase/epimerase